MWFISYYVYVPNHRIHQLCCITCAVSATHLGKENQKYLFRRWLLCRCYLPMLMYVLNDRSLKFIYLFLFKMIWRLTWSILIKRRNGCFPESDTWNYPSASIREIPCFFICIIIEKPPFSIPVDSLILIDCIVSKATGGLIPARQNSRIPRTLALCFDLEWNST